MTQSFVTIPSSLGNIPVSGQQQSLSPTSSAGGYWGQPSDPNKLSIAGQQSPYQIPAGSFSSLGKSLDLGSPIGRGAPDYAGMQKSVSQAQQYFGSQFNSPNLPPTTNPNGSDTEFGQLIRMGGSRNPIQEKRYQELIQEWKNAHPGSTVAPQPELSISAQKAQAKSPTGGTTSLPSVGGMSQGGAQGQISPVMPQLAGMQPSFPASAQMLSPQYLATPQGKAEQQRVIQQARSISPTLGDYIVAGGLAGGGALLGGLAAPELAAALLGGGGALGSEGQQLEQSAQPWLQRGGQQIGNLIQQASNFMKSPFGKVAAPAATVGGLSTAAAVRPSQQQASFDPTQRAFLGPTGQALSKGADQTGKSLAPTSTAAQQKQQLQSFLMNPQAAPAATVAANLANPGGIQMINKEIDNAQKQGDFATVARLTDLATQSQQNMLFQQQIQSIIGAISSGFGTPNAPGVTAARQPMVQQGIFGGLETPQQAPMSFVGGTGQQMPTTYLRQNLPQVSTVMPTPQFPMQQAQGNTPFSPFGRPMNQLPLVQ